MSDTISVKPNGPYVLTGPCKLVDPTGQVHEWSAGKIVALCRCGQSQGKPYCDGSHGRTGFRAADPAPSR